MFKAHLCSVLSSLSTTHCNSKGSQLETQTADRKAFRENNMALSEGHYQGFVLIFHTYAGTISLSFMGTGKGFLSHTNGSVLIWVLRSYNSKISYKHKWHEVCYNICIYHACSYATSSMNSLWPVLTASQFAILITENESAHLNCAISEHKTCDMGNVMQALVPPPQIPKFPVGKLSESELEKLFVIWQCSWSKSYIT